MPRPASSTPTTCSTRRCQPWGRGYHDMLVDQRSSRRPACGRAACSRVPGRQAGACSMGCLRAIRSSSFREKLGALERPGASFVGAARVLRRACPRPADRGGPIGCLMVNSAIELAAAFHPEVSDVVVTGHMARPSERNAARAAHRLRARRGAGHADPDARAKPVATGDGLMVVGKIALARRCCARCRRRLQRPQQRPPRPEGGAAARGARATRCRATPRGAVIGRAAPPALRGL